MAADMSAVSNYKLQTTDYKLVAIVGETASGKSSLAMNLARQFHGEIICADSLTVYRGFDVGTAKPSEKDRVEVAHHLLDIADPAKGFSVAEFKPQAERAIKAVQARGKLPIMVGGSGLYVDSVLYDYRFSSFADTDERDVLNTMSLAELTKIAHGRGLTTAGTDMLNPRRVMRLIETNGASAYRSEMRPQTCVLGLTTDRGVLKVQVKTRLETMLSKGLEDEVKSLAKRYGWDCEPMRAVGYREWQAYFAGQATYDETIASVEAATMRLAKKQRTWFKRNNSIQWISDPSQAVEIVTTFLNK